MELWLDTTDISTVQEAKRLGLLGGISTDPGSKEVLTQLLEEQEGPVAVLATTVAVGKALHQFSSRIIVKVPVSKEGLEVISALAEEEIPVCGTAIFHVNQAWLASLAGATYAEFLLSKIERGGDRTKEVLESFTKSCQIKLLATSVRSAEQVKACAEFGIHAVVVKKDLFGDLTETHELTKGAVEECPKDFFL